MKEISETFDMCVFTHVYREANMCADWATNLVCHSDKIITLYGESNLACEAKSMFELDRIQMKQCGITNHNS